jgi:ABC-type bacteriocin/lantibiotic exporter with double-glycine peptidase domain
MSQAKDRKSSIQLFWKLLREYKSEVNSIYIYAFFNALISLSVPLGIQAIINLIQGAQISTSWIVVVILVTAGVIATGVLIILQLAISENMQQKIFVHSAFDFANRIPKFKTEAVDREFIPELINRFFDTITVQKGISKIILDYSIAVIQVVLGLILLMFYHPFFISFGIFLVLIVYLIMKHTFPAGLDSSIRESKYKYQLVHWLEDLGRSMKTFKLAGKSELPLEKTDRITSEWVKYRNKHFKILLIQYICMVGFKALIAAGLLVIGGILVINQQMNIGQFVAAEIIILIILVSVEKLFTGTETFFDVLTSLNKLREVTDIPLESSGNLRLEPSGTGFSVEIQELSFHFPGNTNPALSDISFDIRPGERLGLAGSNGSGKSTLLKIIAGLYTEYSGAISFDRFPMRNLDMEDLRGIVGDNLKENTLFNGTILENISMGRTPVSMDELIKVCDLVDLMRYIEASPLGMETPLLSEGKTLSNSIKVKIVLARCFAVKPRLILLEDNFDELDRDTRLKIQKHLLDPAHGWTLVLASNDDDILKILDRVVVLEKGRIVAAGSYDELSADHRIRKIFQKGKDA